MFVAEMPDLPPQSPAMVMVTQAAQKQKKNAERIAGNCVFAQVYDGPHQTQADIRPEIDATEYRRNFDKQPEASFDGAKVTILKQPKHGTLNNKYWDPVTSEYEDPGQDPLFVSRYYYRPDEGYWGKDFAVMQAEKDGIKIKLYYFIHVSNEVKPYYKCEVQDSAPWKISSGPNGEHTLAAQSELAQGAIARPYHDVSLSFAELPSGALGETQSSTITLDTTAAGHGWFIDPTPWDNSEFLPTADPNIWLAKPGSAAEGRMDMLSVLLHEYGHVLGLEHSANPTDVMVPTLQPGERRLWSAEELAQGVQMLSAKWTQMADGGIGKDDGGNSPFRG